MALSERDRKNVLVLIIVLAVGSAGAFWFLWREPKAQEAAQLQAEVDSLQARVDQAKRDLAQGTVEDLRERIAVYERSLGLMRQLVPTENEVPQLIDDIASRAALRNVDIAEFARQSQEPGGVFETYRYRLTIYGHYDEIGEFMSDVASLPRIMVPYDVTLDPADANQQALYADTTGALLRGQFLLRTFVKSPTEGGTSESQ
ncbi:MAG: type 4a pilus biogenesis protein PilO [Gemmatimonadales bacterium]